MDITLNDPSPDNTRTYYAGHNFLDENVEYLQMDVSNDRKKATILVSSLSPFDIVYKDIKKPSPDTPTYIIPKTGVK